MGGGAQRRPVGLVGPPVARAAERVEAQWKLRPAQALLGALATGRRPEDREDVVRTAAGRVEACAPGGQHLAVELVGRHAVADRLQQRVAALPVPARRALQHRRTVVARSHLQRDAHRVIAAHAVTARRDAAELHRVHAMRGGNREVPHRRHRVVPRHRIGPALEAAQPVLHPAVPPGLQLARHAAVEKVAGGGQLAVPADLFVDRHPGLRGKTAVHARSPFRSFALRGTVAMGAGRARDGDTARRHPALLRPGCEKHDSPHWRFRPCPS